MPSAIALLDPTLFQRDWLIQHVVDGVNVRTVFVYLLAAAGSILSIPVAAAVLHVLVFLATGWGVYALGRAVTGDTLAAGLGTFVALAVTPAFTLGANSLVYSSIVPEGVAWPLAVAAVALFLRRRWVPAGALLGLAAWVHLLTGLLPALVLGLVAIWRSVERAHGYGMDATMRFGLAFVVASLPIAIPVALGQLGGNPGRLEPSAFYIHAVFRNPFHHLFSAFPPGQFVRFGAVMAAGLAGVWMARARPATGDVLRLWAVIGLLCVLAIVFVDLVPVAFVAKLQFFKLTVLAGLMAALLAAVPLAAGLRRAATRLAPAIAGHLDGDGRTPWPSRVALPLAAAVVVMALTLRDGPAARVGPVRHAETALAATEEWAASSTPPDALFAVPPSVGTFRTFGRRAVVANWHGFVFDDDAMHDWYERLMAVAPIPPPDPTLDRKPLLDSSYSARSAADWRRLEARYGIDYLVVRTGRPDLPFRVAYTNPDWTVYSLGRPRGAASGI